MNFEERKSCVECVHQSDIKCAYACNRKYFLERKMGVRLRGKYVKESADLGTILHKLMRNGPGEEVKTKHWLIDKQKALMVLVDAGEDIDGTLVMRANMLTDLYNKALAMAQVLWEQYPEPDYLETVVKELHWECDTLYGLRLCGDIDRICLNHKDNAYWIRDYKSTGRGLDAIFGGAGWGVQARIYRILALDWLENVRGENALVRGFILDGIVKPAIKLCGKDEKTAKEQNITPAKAYLERVKSWYGEKLADTVRAQALFYCEPVMPEELSTALSVMGDLMTRENQPALYDRDITRTACWLYERQCPYAQLCDTPEDQWDALFERTYKLVDNTEDHDD